MIQAQLLALRRPLPWGQRVSVPLVPGDWYKTILATTGVAAAVSLVSMWADMRLMREGVQQLKVAVERQANAADAIEARVLRLEIRVERLTK